MPIYWTQMLRRLSLSKPNLTRSPRKTPCSFVNLSIIISCLTLLMACHPPPADDLKQPVAIPATPPDRLVSAACPDDGPTVWTGPHEHNGQPYWASLIWAEGGVAACLAVVTGEPPQAELLAHKTIEAGYSERYGTSTAPDFGFEPLLWLDGQGFVVTTRQTQGVGGGGGDLTTIWRLAEGALSPAVSFSLESYTNLNTQMESPCPGRLNYYRLQDGGLWVDSCFDGQPRQQWYRFDGQQFIPTESVMAAQPTVMVSQTALLTTTQSAGLTATLHRDGQLIIERTDGLRQTLPTAVMDESPEHWPNYPYRLRIADLDGDGQPEVVLIVSTAGASCCTTLSVAYFDARGQRYRLTEPRYRKFTLGFELIDLDGDGLLEIQTLNEGFNAALGGATVVSFISPLQIWRYGGGTLHEVTANFPDLLEAQAERWLEDERCDLFSAGAYLASMHQLGQAEIGWQAVDGRCTLSLLELQQIRQALREFGYAEPPVMVEFSPPPPPLSWTVAVLQRDMAFTGEEITLRPEPFTVQVTLPQPLSLALNLSAELTPFQRLRPGLDMTAQPSLPFGPAAAFAEGYFGACRCLILDPLGSHALPYVSVDEHRWNQVTLKPDGVIFRRQVKRFIQAGQAIPLTEFTGTVYLSLWVDYRHEGVIDGDELRQVRLDLKAD